MKIWYLNTANQLPGDGWRQSRSSMICELLAERGHSVLWWTSNFSHHTKQFRAEGWKDVVVNSHLLIRMVPTVSYRRNICLRRILSDVVFAWRIYRRSRSVSLPDCIIIYDSPLISTFIARRLAHRTGAAFILDVHDLMPELFVMVLPKIFRRWERAIFSPLYAFRRFSRRRGDAVLALSEDYLNNALQDVPALRNRPNAVIFNGIDVVKFRRMGVDAKDVDRLKKKKGKADGEIWAIYAGSLGNNYDIPTLIQTAKLLVDRSGSSRIKILIAGDGPLRSLVMDFISSQRLTNVHYLGRLTPEELVQYYQVCDIGLCAYGPLSNVAMPDKGYDYMAVGLAIVNSLKGEFERLLRKKHIGLQYQAGYPASLMKVLNILARDDEMRLRMGANAYALALQYDKYIQYPQFCDVVEYSIKDWPRG